jgi:GST-like protein
MIDLHDWPTPDGWKISIALEEMDLPYRFHYVNIGRGNQLKREFLALSPNNRMRAIVDHDPIGGGEPLARSSSPARFCAIWPRSRGNSSHPISGGAAK